ncbi:MAG: glycosyltransferase WbsX family protein [Bacteroidota bacterium]
MKAGKYIFFSLLIFLSCGRTPEKDTRDSQKIDVAAYFWPSCQNEERSRNKLWSEGIGEWEIINKCTPRFEGHYQPRQPFWGYLMDDDPAVMEKKIEAATSHGVNVFIFDWYWYDGKPFLEEALNDGFLKAQNKDKMSFFLMWANHDVPGNMWNPYRYKSDSLLWEGNVNWPQYEKLVERVITRYFNQSNYYKIDNKPVFSLYSLEELIQSFNDLEGAAKALDYLRQQTIEAGFGGLHLQLVGKYSYVQPNFGEGLLDVNKISEMLKANSITMYNMAGNEFRKGDYIPYMDNAIKIRNAWDEILTLPFIPCISVGWDNTPRYLNMGKEDIIYMNNTPQSFGAGLIKAKEYLMDRPEQPQVIVINAWNEWVEGSYLEPDLRWGYGYMEKLKEVILY